MKVFVAQVDTPLGHNISRVLSFTAVGSRREEEPNEEEEVAEEDDKPKDDKPAKETYQVVGSIAGRPKTSDILASPTLVGRVGARPGQFIEHGM